MRGSRLFMVPGVLVSIFISGCDCGGSTLVGDSDGDLIIEPEPDDAADDVAVEDFEDFVDIVDIVDIDTIDISDEPLPCGEVQIIQVTDNPCSSLSPSMAWTGSEFGIAWYDARAVDSGCRDWDTYSVYFVRLDENGNRLTADTLVAGSENGDINPDVVWTGSEFGIAWNRVNIGSRWYVYFARVGLDGSRLSSEVQVSDNDSAHDPAVVWTGSGYVIFWPDWSAGNVEISFAVLDADGSRTGDSVELTASGGDNRNPIPAWTGSEIGVVWSRDGSLYFVRLDAGGIRMGEEQRITNSIYSGYPDMVWTGESFAVAWRDGRDGNDEIYFSLLDSTGHKIVDDTRITTADGYSVDPRIAWTGSEFGISWHDNRGETEEWDILFARVSPSGGRIGDDIKLLDDEMFSPPVVWTGETYAFTWHHPVEGNTEIFLAFLRCNIL